MTYEQQLKDERWLLLREEVLNRDFGICQKCMSSKNLNIHHKQYIPGRLAWEYPIAYLITLCEKCHLKHHENHEIKVSEPDIIIEAGERIRQSVWAIKQMDKRHG